MKYEIEDVINAKNKVNNGFENLYKSIYEDLYKMALYIMGNNEQAQDIVSETVLDAYYGISKLKDTDKFEAWILKILTNKCKKKLREKYEKITVFNPKVMDISQEAKENGTNDDAIEKLEVREALAKLNEKERIIVTLCVVEGYKSSEVAKVLNMNSSTVRSKLNRSLAKMRQYIM